MIDNLAMSFRIQLQRRMQSTPSRLSSLTLLIVALGLSPGCYYTTTHGDARVGHQLPKITRHEDILLPRTTLNSPHTKCYEVRGLPFPMFPRQIEIPQREGDSILDSRNAPWASAKIRIEFTMLTGETIASCDFDFQQTDSSGSTMAHPLDKGDRRLTTFYLFHFDDWNQLKRGFWELRDWNVLVTVHEPSSRPDDWLRITGWRLQKRTINGVEEFSPP